MPLELSDAELSTAATACRALAYQEGERAKAMENPDMRRPIENTAHRFAALAARFEAARRRSNTSSVESCPAALAVGRASRMQTRMLRAVAALALAGCAGTTHVVPTGSDPYMIAAHGTMGWSSGPAQKAKAFEEAAAYCKQSGKHLETIDATDTGAGTWGKISSAEVHFRCASSATSK
jgi:hypothetical protein